MRPRLACATLALLVATLPFAAQAADPVLLRFASTTVPQSKVNVWGITPWIEDVHKAAGDALEIKLFTGTAVANVENVYDRTVQGVVDASFGIFGPYFDIFPRVMVGGLPFEASNCTETAIALWRLFDRGLISEEFAKVKVLSLFTFAPPAINSNRPIRTADDMKGIKIAASGRIVSDMMKAVGATPITMGPPDFYQAMQRGLVHAIAVGWPAIMSFRLDEVSKYHLETETGQFPAFVFMNKDAYARLPEAGRRAIDQHSGEPFFRRMGNVTDRQDAEGRELTRAKPGQVIEKLAPEEAARWKRLAAPIVEQWAKTTPNGEAILAAFRQEIQNVRKGI